MTSLNSHQVRIRKNGEVFFPHTDFESHPITVWHEDGEYIVFKIPAGRHWESIINNSVPHPGKYMIAQIEDDSTPEGMTDIRYLRVRSLFEMPLSNRGRDRL